MLTFFKILSQSISLAIHALFAHKLRSFLSVLGVTIGIFCLIIVFSLVDTLEKNIRSSFEELGSDVLFVHRWSFEDGFKLVNQYANLGIGHKIPSTISMRCKDGVFIEDVKEEIRGALRKNRRLKPREVDNFSINEISLLDEVLNKVFFALNAAGGIIGFFALLVGMFGIANIMFVSVKERTNIIGIKKALGAKSYVILLEFLMEAVLLCLFGGALGVLLVGLLLGGISMAMPFDVSLDFQNVRLGLMIAIFTGIFAGIIPAYRAAKMNPIVAIRS